MTLAAGGLLLTASTVALAASKTTTGTVQITGYTALSMTKASDLKFGLVTVPSSGTGSVIITPGASAAYSTSGGASQGCGAGLCAQAAFNVTGQASASVALTLPTTVNLVKSVGSTLTATLSMDQNRTTSMSGAGSLTVHVGGTLVVPTSAATGSYSGAFTLRAIYN